MTRFFCGDASRSLELALDTIGKQKEADADLYDICRAACVKEFELVFGTERQTAAKTYCGILFQQPAGRSSGFQRSIPVCRQARADRTGSSQRWLYYRDNRTDTAYNYGEDFAEATLRLLPAFVADAKALADMIEEVNGG